MQLSGSNAVGSATVDVTTGAVATLGGIPSGARRAFVTVEGRIRFWVNGTEPIATSGHTAEPGDAIELDDPAQLSGFRAIATGTNATLQVTYF